MPRLVGDALGPAGRIGEGKAEPSGMCRQPLVRRRARKVFLEIEMAVGADVDRPPGVVLAEARRGHVSQDLRHCFSRGELARDDLTLTFDGAESRDRDQFNPVALGGTPHRLPCRCGWLHQLEFTAVGIPADEHKFTRSRFLMQHHSALRPVLLGNAELRVNYRQPRRQR